MERRLTAILIADVVGFSRLMEKDEVGTHAALQAHRDDLIAPTIAAKSGRIVKLMGDGIFVEFVSVVDAVSSAIAIQEGLRDRNMDIEQERRIELRIGVHLGDVIVDGDDLYGDGVNVAARIESLAEPGGICLSQQALDQVETKLDLVFADMGEQAVKNIARPVHVHRIVFEDSAAPLDRMVKPGNRRRAASFGIVGAVAILAAVALVALWWRPWVATVQPAAIERMAHSLPARPSVAVLPFANLSADGGQRHFIDGMTDDLITELSRIKGIFVIARSSTAAFRKQSVSIPRVAEKLGRAIRTGGKCSPRRQKIEGQCQVDRRDFRKVHLGETL